MAKLVLIALLLGAYAGLVLVETLHDGAWETAAKVMGIVEAILIPMALCVYRRQFRERLQVSFGLTIFFLVILSSAGLFLGAPYVFLINAASSPGEAVTFEGPVLSKHAHSGKSTARFVEVLDHDSGQPVQFRVQPHVYESVKVGATMSRCMQMGGLGIPFRWSVFSTSACPPREGDVPQSC